ncbi:unnamed protein product [Periconia digitata]|uniref:Actin-like ATPase domain-containing protein n=1 Tax=Periconia digitata TaxID=1303443 RepID=A0A9W4UAC5_9PLEO|nr:unnamed protein product [Periconia digitata]
MSGNELVIGVDYGTTSTGVCYTEQPKFSDIEPILKVVQDWPASQSNNGTQDKVPSEIAYIDGRKLWGFRIPENVQRLIWTKLELDPPNSGVAKTIRKELQASSYGGVAGVKKPMDVIADYLSGIENHLIKNLDRRYGTALWRTMPMTLVITVPAVWSDSAKDQTLQAFSKAGFNNEVFKKLKNTITVTEPEAAAVYTIKELRGRMMEAVLQVGDAFVLCDMGGGTVDLISYEVTSIDPVVIKEATVGTGGQCGASTVERAFLKMLETRLGENEFQEIAGCTAEELSHTSIPANLVKVVKNFSEEKRIFGDEEYQPDKIYISGLPFPWSSKRKDNVRGIEKGELVLNVSEMESMFQISLDETVDLLQKQLQKVAENSESELKYIFLVGGFSNSPYMQRKIGDFAESHSGIRVLKPLQPWSAIVRGAVYKGLEAQNTAAMRSVSSRKCRRHYGTDYSAPYDAEKHQYKDRYVDEKTGKLRAKDQMEWIINKGQDLPTSEALHGKHTFSFRFWPKESRVVTIEFFATDMDKAPSHRKDEGVYHIANLKIDLGAVPKTEYHSKPSPTGRTYLDLDFDIEISVQSALEFSLSVNGIRYGSVKADYV